MCVERPSMDSECREKCQVHLIYVPVPIAIHLSICLSIFFYIAIFMFATHARMHTRTHAPLTSRVLLIHDIVTQCFRCGLRPVHTQFRPKAVNSS